MFRTETLWIAALLATGLVGGLIYNWPDSVGEAVENDAVQSANRQPASTDPGPEKDPESVQDAESRENPQSETLAPSESLQSLPQSMPQDDVWSDLAPETDRRQAIDSNVRELGDTLLIGGNAAGAYRHYSKLWKQANVPLDPAILIRLAVSAELAGLYQESEQHYRAAIRVCSAGSMRQLICFLGTARLWEKQGQLDDAISLLSELYLRFSDERQPVIIRKSITQQLADALQKRLLRSPVVIEAIDKEPMEYHWTDLIVEPILEVADSEANELATERPAQGIRVLQNPRGEASLILVEIHHSGYAVLDFLADLERRCGLRFDLSERAKSTMVGRLTNIDTNAMPLSLLLDQTLEFLHLNWSQDGGVVRVMHREELTVQDAASFQLGKTQRMLRQIQMLLPDAGEAVFFDRLVRTTALMNDGNNCRLSGEWEMAAAKYSAARDADPKHELNAKLFFNTATLQLANGDKLKALHSCYMTLDQTLVAALQAQVYAMIAELELELGQPQKAITAGGRGLRRARDPNVLTRTALTLARAYLIANDPDSANLVLFNHSDHIHGAKEKRLASVFSTFARYLRVPQQSGLQDEGQRLVMALASLQPADVDNFIDSMLISNAYASIGIRSQATETLRQSLEEAPEGFWGERIRIDLAKAMYESADFKGANTIIEGFQNVSTDRLPAALHWHAKIQLKLGEWTTSEAICRRLLAMKIDDETKSKTLNVLGQSLRSQGKHYASALCFAGMLPDLESNSPADTPSQSTTANQ